MKNKITKFDKTEDLFKKIKEVIDSARNRAYRAVNFTMVQAYWNVGRLIVEEEQSGKERARYGECIIVVLSNRLTNAYGKGFDERNLRFIRSFYLSFPIRNALRSELSWTHYRLLSKVENKSVREFYLEECTKCNWSTRQLERQINSFYYERLLSSKNKKVVRNEIKTLEPNISPSDIIKDPYVLEFLDIKENTKFLESNLEQALLDNLQKFLLELGKGFSFVTRQKRITLNGDHFYIDLVFYNYILKCFVLIDLKVGRLTHQDIGQIDFYVRYFEEHEKAISDNPTIGIILCSEKNEAVAKYSVLKDNKKLFASKYKLYLPTEEELRKELLRKKQLVEIDK